jgi:hypothetical protein
MPAERPVPILPADAIFSVGKTPHPQDLAVNQIMGGVMERLGDIEEIVKSMNTFSIKLETRIETPDVSEIPQWQGRRQDGSSLDFLKAHYGQWLSAFGTEKKPQEDIIFQDQIRSHDPKLLRGVMNQLHEEGQGRKIKEVVKTRSARVDRELANLLPDSLTRAERLGAAMRMRQTRKSPKSSSA